MHLAAMHLAAMLCHDLHASSTDELQHTVLMSVVGYSMKHILNETLDEILDEIL